MTLRLAHAGWEVDVRPALGGAIAACRWRGADVLRPAPDDADHPLAAACFPLVPYANRIADGRFAVDATQYDLPPNAAGQAHPLHGVGWLSAWSVVAADGRGATLVHAHAGDAHWPWAYAAEQRIALDDGGLRVSLSATNRADRPMPVSLGLHPYFLRAGVTALRFAAEGVWLADAAMLPTERVAPDRLGDWARGAGVAPATLVDNCYAGWPGTAAIARTGGDLLLSGENTPFLHLFMPPGERFFCAEPVTAMPDAFNRAALPLLAPGATHAIAMTIAPA